MKLSNKLIELRKEKGWSQEEFAEKLDISRQAVSRWENETALPDAQNILRISKLFNVTADYLLNDDCEKEGDIHTSPLKTEAKMVRKKKYPYLIYAICFTVIVLLTCALIGVVISKNSSENKGLHTHDISLSTVWENEIASTCTLEGSYDEVIYCNECNEELLRTRKTTNMLAHTPSKTIKENEIAPTCTLEGSYDEVIYCAVCNDEILRTQISIEIIAHQYQDKKCITCGKNQPSERLFYMSNGDGTCTVSLGGCTDENIVIPDHSPSGDKVTRIKAYAFYGCADLKSVEIPETVTLIGEGAFQDCMRLESLNLPSKIKMIYPYTFDGCTNLKGVTIPAGVTYIGMEAFADCESFESIVIPASVTKIEKFAFMNFSNTSTGTVIFENNNGWVAIDDTGSEEAVDFYSGRFTPIMYLTFIYADYTWERR